MATQNPNQWITCKQCSQRFVRSQNVQGVVALATNPEYTYYVADQVPTMFHFPPENGEIASTGIRGANQVTDLTMIPVLCSTCWDFSGWKVLRQTQSHPIVYVGQFLLPAPPPPPPPPFPLHPQP